MRHEGYQMNRNGYGYPYPDSSATYIRQESKIRKISTCADNEHQ